MPHHTKGGVCLFFSSDERRRDSIAIEKSSKYAYYSPFNLVALVDGCLDGFGVVAVVVVIVSDDFADDVFDIGIIGKPRCTKTCFRHFMTSSIDFAIGNAIIMMLM